MFFKCSSIAHQRVVKAAAIFAAFFLLAQPDPFTILVAMALLVCLGSLFVAASGLLWGRAGVLMATAATLVVIVAVLIFPLIR
jgi:hypothetical protein